MADSDSNLEPIAAPELEQLIEVPYRYVSDPSELSAARVTGRSTELALAALAAVFLLLFSELLLATPFGLRRGVTKTHRG